MQLIKPSEISGQIMTLIEEADKKVILVSPYFKISKWFKLVKRLEELKSRNIDVEIFVRENEDDSIREVENLGFTPIVVPNLHTKLYLNEKEAIVSSMNLLLSSDNSSIDIALKTQNQQEYNELFEYYTRYIKNRASNNNHVGYHDWREELEKQLKQSFGEKVWISETKGNLQINTKNRYEAHIDKTDKGLYISGILSGKEFEFAQKNKKSLSTAKSMVELRPGGKGYYDTAWGIKTGIKSYYINELQKSDEKNVVEAIVEFICTIENLKNTLRQQ